MILLILETTELLIQVTITIFEPRQEEFHVLEDPVLPCSSTLLTLLWGLQEEKGMCPHWTHASLLDHVPGIWNSEST